MPEEDILISEYKKRIERTKTEAELERIKLDEIKELKKQVFVEYEQKRDEFEQKQIEIDEKSKKIDEKQAILEQKEKQLLGKNLVIQLEDGSIEIISKDDIDIVSDKDVIKKTRGSID